MLLSHMDRYVLRETVWISAMTLLVLTAITLALFFAELLGDVGQGQVAAARVFRLLGLRIPEVLLLIAPLALMLGLMMALGQMAQQHELGSFRSSGLSPLRLMKPVLLLTGFWALALLMIAGWLSPWAERQIVEINKNLAEELLLSSLRAGQFMSIDDDGSSIYVERIEADKAGLENVFIYFADENGAEVITARDGRLQIDAQQGRRILTLFDGVHLRHESDQPSALRKIEFERNDIFLPHGSSTEEANPAAAMNLGELFYSSQPELLAERHARLAPAIVAVLFMLIALPVTLERPHGNRMGFVLIGLLAYLLYSNAVYIALNAIESSTALSRFGLWPMHASALLLVVPFWLYWYRRW